MACEFPQWWGRLSANCYIRILYFYYTHHRSAWIIQLHSTGGANVHLTYDIVPCPWHRRVHNSNNWFSRFCTARIVTNGKTDRPCYVRSNRLRLMLCIVMVAIKDSAICVWDLALWQTICACNKCKQQQQQQPINGRLSGTTNANIDRIQKRRNTNIPYCYTLNNSTTLKLLESKIQSSTIQIMKPSCAVRIHRQALLLLSLVIFLHNDYSPCIVKFDDILYDFSLHSYLLLSYFCQW